MPDDTLVLSAERTLDRKRVLGAEMVEDVLAALFELVIQVGIVEDRQARMGDGMARELESLGGPDFREGLVDQPVGLVDLAVLEKLAGTKVIIEAPVESEPPDGRGPFEEVVRPGGDARRLPDDILDGTPDEGPLVARPLDLARDDMERRRKVEPPHQGHGDAELVGAVVVIGQRDRGCLPVLPFDDLGPEILAAAAELRGQTRQSRQYDQGLVVMLHESLRGRSALQENCTTNLERPEVNGVGQDDRPAADDEPDHEKRQ